MMRDEEITYATVRFHKSSGLQSPSRPDETQGPKDSRTFAGGKGCSCPWKPVVIPLGVLCSLLLVTVIVLLTHIFQYHQEKHKLQETLRNLHYNYSNVQNDCNLKEEKLRNKSRECDDLKDELDSLKREWNRCYGNTKTVLDFSHALNNPSYHRKIGGCVFLSKTRLEVEQCGRSYPCICEKRLDKFHDSLSKNT
nr:killer cell lectin-like receptor 2 [Meriones unguiculatus]